MLNSEISKQDKKLAHRWLYKISSPAKKWVRLTVLVNFISGILLIGQFYLLSCIAYDAYLQKYFLQELHIYFLAIVIIALSRAGLSWLSEVVSYKAAIIVKKQLREDIITHINKLGPIGIRQTSNANIISSSMEQVEGLTDFLTKFLPQITLSGLLPLAILAFVFPQSMVAGIILLVCAPLIPIFMIIIGTGAGSESQKQFKFLSRMNLTFLDTLKGLTTLKFFNRNKSQSKKIFKASDNYRIHTMKVLKIAFLSSAALELFAAASIALVAIYLGMGFINAGADNNIWWSLKNLNLQGALFILLLAPEFFMPLRELSRNYHAKAEAIGAALEIAKIFEMRPHSHNRNINLKDKIQTIDIKNLTVKYEGKSAVSNISLKIQNKQKIAIVGSSGSGKTTFINTILGFIKYQGNIIINNSIELKDIKEKSWLKNISWLGQNASLFKGSIKSNLALANIKTTTKDLTKVMTQTNLNSFINSLPNGLDSQIGEQNSNLSGGQVQKLALARAYLKPHDILILDEPTASLDKESETQIISSLRSIWCNTTVIILTHKLSFLEHVDQIFVLENGHLVQQGTFDNLIKKKDGKFYNLYKNEII